MSDNDTAPTSALSAAEQGPASLERYIRRISEDFNDPSQEWRRLFSELLGTFFLVLVAAGGGAIGAEDVVGTGGKRRSAGKSGKRERGKSEAHGGSLG